eukprot:scaffold1102_cov256-Pinguiococcus_pyrenoidosus.AAC.1
MEAHTEAEQLLLALYAERKALPERHKVSEWLGRRLGEELERFTNFEIQGRLTRAAVSPDRPPTPTEALRHSGCEGQSEPRELGGVARSAAFAISGGAKSAQPPVPEDPRGPNPPSAVTNSTTGDVALLCASEPSVQAGRRFEAGRGIESTICATSSSSIESAICATTG